MRAPSKPIEPHEPSMLIKCNNDLKYSAVEYSYISSMIEYFKSILGEKFDIEQITVETDTSYDSRADHNTTTMVFNYNMLMTDIPNPNYARQYDDYEKELKKYKAAVLKYESDLTAYEQYMIDYKVKAKQKEIDDAIKILQKHNINIGS